MVAPSIFQRSLASAKALKRSLVKCARPAAGDDDDDDDDDDDGVDGVDGDTRPFSLTN